MRTTSTGGLRLAALVEYDGTAYAGFQWQKGRSTIQSTLEHSLERIVGHAVRVVGAGRTDAGVHALGQVVHLRATWKHSLADLQRAWSASLPRDVVVHALSEVSDDFHARFSARSRVYRYHIYNARVRSPLHERYSWHVDRQLRIQDMQRAIAVLVGRQDLASFGRAPQGENTVRTVLRAAVWGQGALVCLEVEADAFLQHMMRRVAASLVAVGLGRLTVDEFAAAVDGRSPHLVASMAPPQGLCLIAVHYDAGALRWIPAQPASW
ncbi:MAG: tRNA pseudouridine(38-40) synthase TruA [Anaerolineae bacterium]